MEPASPFYIRRFLRIFPIYYLVLAVTWALGVPDVRSGMVWHLAYGSNVLFAIQNRWPQATSHLWSLSVEEQFYLIWPLLMFLVPRRHLGIVVLAFIFTGPLFRMAGYLAGLNSIALQVLLPASFDSLGVDAWLLYRLTSPAGLPYRTRNPGIFLVFSTISIALAAMSWHWYEAPINRLKRRFPYTA